FPSFRQSAPACRKMQRISQRKPMVDQRIDYGKGAGDMAEKESKSELRIPAYEGRGVELRAGDELIIEDVRGKQVCDFVCFNKHDTQEYVSPVHMRASLSSIRL